MVRTVFNTGQLEWPTSACIYATTLAFGCSLCSGFGICLMLVENYLSCLNFQEGLRITTLCNFRACIISFWMIVIILSFVPVYTSVQAKVDISKGFCYHTGLSMQISFLSLIAILVTMLILMIHIMLTVRKHQKNLFKCDITTAANLLKQRRLKKNAKLATIVHHNCCGVYLELGAFHSNYGCKDDMSTLS